MKKLLRHWRSYRRTRGATREVLTVLLSLLLGLVVLPALLYVAAVPILGPYENGGYFSLMGDLISALGHGSVPFWLFVLGPYGAIWLWRFWRWNLRGH